MYLQAKQWSSRPSEILDVQDPYAAFCLDSAIWEFGTYVESELESVKGKNEKQRQAGREARLKSLLSDSPDTKKFADPMAMLSKNNSKD